MAPYLKFYKSHNEAPKLYKMHNVTPDTSL